MIQAPDKFNQPTGEVAVVTCTNNRLALLQRLYRSLVLQSDLSFTWVVVDDSSSDGTDQWIESVASGAPFQIILITNSMNIGKCRSLNRAFDAVRAELFVVVDSDDRLNPTAIATIKSALGAVDDSVGALFFCFVDPYGSPLGGPPNGKDLITSRAALDSKYGKYDGCVAYRSTVINEFRYPEFPEETYLAPTVLQLLMDPHCQVLFASSVVGVADYQPDGLTRRGRSLRLKNPRGMMLYSRLLAEQAHGWRFRMKYRVSYWAYRTSPQLRGSKDLGNIPTPPRGSPLDVILGWCVGTHWRWASRRSSTRSFMSGSAPGRVRGLVNRYQFKSKTLTDGAQ